MARGPVTVGLAVVSAMVIVVGRMNHETAWGDWVGVAGFAVLVVAGPLALRSRR